MRFLVAVFLVLSMALPAAADPYARYAVGTTNPHLSTPTRLLRVGEDWGGNLGGFARAVRTLNATNTLVVVDGRCASACTMLMALPPAQLCFAPDARFGFHGVRGMLLGNKVADPALQRRHDLLVGTTYPGAVQARYMETWRHIGWLANHHWETGASLVAMAPDHLRLCSDAELTEARRVPLQRTHGKPTKRKG